MVRRQPTISAPCYKWMTQGEAGVESQLLFGGWWDAQWNFWYLWLQNNKGPTNTQCILLHFAWHNKWPKKKQVNRQKYLYLALYVRQWFVQLYSLWCQKGLVSIIACFKTLLGPRGLATNFHRQGHNGLQNVIEGPEQQQMAGVFWWFTPLKKKKKICRKHCLTSTWNEQTYQNKRCPRVVSSFVFTI